MKKETILNYYLKDIEYYKAKQYDKQFDPDNWIKLSPKIDISFAKYIEYLLKNSYENNLIIENIPTLVSEFYYQCISCHRILFDEECKKNKALKQLFIDTKYEIDDLGAEDCNTSQKIIDLTLNLILKPNIVFEKFKYLKECDWDYISATDLVQHKSFSDYLYNCLETSCDSSNINMLIENLAYQNDTRLYENIEKYLNPNFVSENDFKMLNTEIQSATIRYLRKVNFNIRNRLLVTNETKIFKDNEAEFIVTKALIEKGEAGLINLYQETDNLDIKMEIIDCYDQIKSKEFARLLIDALNDEIKLNNGYFPIRNEAFFKLKEELFSNLIEWFGDDILNVFSETTLEEEA